jgi:ABC-type transport system involved in cytochrome bd biosynthesis fused ATPase/permease subunit
LVNPKVPAAQAFANKMQEALLNAKKALKAAQQRRRSMLTKIDAMSLSQLKMRHFLVLKTSGIETLVVHLNSYLRGSVPSLS